MSNIIDLFPEADEYFARTPVRVLLDAVFVKSWESLPDIDKAQYILTDHRYYDNYCQAKSMGDDLYNDLTSHGLHKINPMICADYPDSPELTELLQYHCYPIIAEECEE